jgi:hypothetical protein
MSGLLGNRLDSAGSRRSRYRLRTSSRTAALIAVAVAFTDVTISGALAQQDCAGGQSPRGPSSEALPP